jgi:membrane associated rhomboid family serine protease
MEENTRPQIVETFLSRPPGKGSAAVSFFVLAIVFLFSLAFWGNSFGLREDLIVDRDKVFGSNQYWRLFTGMLVHADVSHYLSNALGLFFFGYLLYGYFGAAVYPVGIAVLGTMVNLISIATYSSGSRLLGASGAVYVMAAFWLTLFVSAERRFSLAQRLARSLGFALIMLLSSAFDPTVSYRTHYIGFQAGILFGVIYFLKRKDQIRAYEVISDE